MIDSSSPGGHTELEVLTNASGIGPATLDDFREADFESAEDVGLCTPEELSDSVNGVGYSTAISVLKYLEKEGLRDTSNRDRDLEQLVELLQDLFEFDHQDRDFGVYKLMNANREEIEEFIKDELVDKVENEVAKLQEQFSGKSEEEARAEIVDELGGDAFAGDSLSEDAKRRIQEKASGASERELENIRSDIYNHVYKFFSNYYESGDFINQRKRSHHSEPYSVPYDGSNTHFHWVTKDQYHAKNSEHFTRFTFKQDGFKYSFELRDGEIYDTHSESNKSEYFIMGEPSQINVDEAQQTVRIPFYRQTVDDDELLQRCDVSQNNAASFKNTFVVEAFEKLTNEGVPISEEDLEKKFDEYLQKTQNDFFIHKDIESFLLNELEEYIKTEVVSFDPKSGTDSITEISTEKGRVVNEIATNIISFVSQIEEFKKKVFEKEKFVLDRKEFRQVAEVDSEYYGTILRNTDQLEEWEDSYGIDAGRLDHQDLETQPYNQMMVNTEHFDNVLAPAEEPDNKLIQADNYQALSFLQERYEKSVKCIYIDPPYNTGNGHFAYKDNYQRPTWLSMMYDRLKLSRELLTEDGAIFISIDYNEMPRMRTICDQVFGEENFRNTIAVRRGVKNIQSQFDEIDSLTRGYEYLLFYSKSPETRFDNLFVELEEEREGGWNGHWRGTDRPTMRYELFGKTPEEGQWRWSEERSEKAINNYKELENKFEGTNEDIPDEKINEWYKNQDGDPDLLRYNQKNDTVEHYVPPTDEEMLTDDWTDISPYGYHDIKPLFGENPADTPKPVDLIKRILNWVCEDDDIVLDFFAGSGTTGHAVQELNREYDEALNYILVEMLDEAFNITEERIRRVTYSDEWSDGEPAVDDGVVVLQNASVECIKLESYEQALDAIQFDKDQNTLSSYNEFLLNYMLEFGTESSPVFLDTDQLTRPTEYKLNFDMDSQSVDVMTTFNYLLGLEDVCQNNREIAGVEYTLYSGSVGEDDVLVVWRHNAEEVDFEREAQELDGKEYDRVYINGDSLLNGSLPISDEFARRMTNEGELL